MDHDLKQCKCGASIFFALTEKGKPTPLDAKPVRVALLADTQGGLPKIEDGYTGYVSHFATCPNSKEFSRRGKKAGGK